MKRCPECGRNYNDDSMSFCLDDGAELLYGPASMDEPATAILSEPPVLAGGQYGRESATRAQIHSTEQTAILPTGASITSKAKGIDKRLITAPLVLAVIVLGGFFGYRYYKTASGGPINSVAVLPFENRSGSGDIKACPPGK